MPGVPPAMRRRSLLDTALACLNTAALCCLVATLVFAAMDSLRQKVDREELVASAALHQTTAFVPNRRRLLPPPQPSPKPLPSYGAVDLQARS